MGRTFYPVAKWRIIPGTRLFNGPGPGGRDVSHGVNINLRATQGMEERKIAVWYARSVDASEMRPRDAVAGYLDDENPPDHLLVTQSGVSVIDSE